MSATCPNGHLSSAEDYCDTCGAPIDASGVTPQEPGAPGTGASGAPTPPAAASGTPAPGLDPDAAPSGAAASSGGAAPGDSLECPNCQAPNAPGALFCEACGYDFTTGAMPRGAETAGAVLAPGSGPATRSSGDQGQPDGPDFEWVAEIWVDPDWYQTQEAEDSCPSPGLPTIVPLRRRSVLLGRTSQSKNTHPEVELSSDPGVSRRHAQLTTDGARWFVEDLGSSNGTFVGPASGALPDLPIPVGPKTELSDDDRLYVGAWTRVVVRRATPEELDTYA